MGRNDCRLKQTSIYLARSWWANCDVQFMIYKTHPKKVNLDNVAHVINNIVVPMVVNAVPENIFVPKFTQRINISNTNSNWIVKNRNR